MLVRLLVGLVWDLGSCANVGGNADVGSCSVGVGNSVRSDISIVGVGSSSVGVNKSEE